MGTVRHRRWIQCDYAWRPVPSNRTSARIRLGLVVRTRAARIPSSLRYPRPRRVRVRAVRRQGGGAGNAFLLFPGVWHRYRPIAEAGWDEYWISFGGDYVARLVEQGFFSLVDPVLTTGSSDVILHAYLTFIDRLRSEPIGFERLLAASVMEILAGMLGAVHARSTDSRNLEGIRQAKLILEEDMTQVPAIEKLAAAVGMSTTHFHRVFRRQTGLSPYQYHLQLRINRAREMLSGSALTVKEISVALGFESAFHFSKIFKKKAGQSPHHFRRSIQPPTVR